MNHFVSLVIFAIVVSACFALLMKPTDAERWRYFFRLLFYFIGCGFIVAWVMYFFPL
ncbi:MAG: hypothetical protein HY315_06785 [Acidobacteria bacterium]|nr:hypothetical protein [Acidobacteriota bacterium]